MKFENIPVKQGVEKEIALVPAGPFAYLCGSELNHQSDVERARIMPVRVQPVAVDKMRMLHSEFLCARIHPLDKSLLRPGNKFRHCDARIVGARVAGVCLLAVLIGLLPATGASAEEPVLSSEAVVLMEGSTGQVLYEKEATKQLRPASITKIMTLLLIFEAISDGIRRQEYVSVSLYLYLGLFFCIFYGRREVFMLTRMEKLWKTVWSLSGSLPHSIWGRII